MKKPSANERADASRLVTVAGRIASTGEPPCPGRAGWRGRQPRLSMYGCMFFSEEIIVKSFQTSKTSLGTAGDDLSISLGCMGSRGFGRFVRDSNLF